MKKTKKRGKSREQCARDDKYPDVSFPGRNRSFSREDRERSRLEFSFSRGRWTLSFEETTWETREKQFGESVFYKTSPG